jgi:hypothetical protein
MDDMASRLKAKGIRQEDFRRICSVLLNKGFLSRADSGETTRLYDIAVRCEHEIAQYLGFAFPVVLLHAPKPPHFRLVPSHHRDSIYSEPDEELETRREMKVSVVQALAAALLSLRMLYDEHLLERKIDTSGRISIKLTELSLFMSTTLGVAMPTPKTDLKALFLKLKKHGAVDVHIDNLGDDDAVIVIRPEILTLVPEQNIRAAQAAINGTSGTSSEETATAPAEPPDEQQRVAIIPLDLAERKHTGLG